MTPPIRRNTDKPVSNTHDEKILDILLYLSVRDPISFNLIHPRHLTTPYDWIRFIQYATRSPTRDGVGYHARKAIVHFLSTCDIHTITRKEVITLTRIVRPHPDQISNLRSLFTKTRIWGELRW